MDAHRSFVERAEGLAPGCWQVLERKVKYEVQTQERERPENVKERIVVEREFNNIRLVSEVVVHRSEGHVLRLSSCSRSRAGLLLVQGVG